MDCSFSRQRFEEYSLFFSELWVEDYVVVFQQPVGVEWKFLKQMGLVCVAYVHLFLLECFELVVQAIEVFQILVRVNVE